MACILLYLHCVIRDIVHYLLSGVGTGGDSVGEREREGEQTQVIQCTRVILVTYSNSLIHIPFQHVANQCAFCNAIFQTTSFY